MPLYKLTETETGRIVTLFKDGDLLVADHNNPNFEGIVERIRNDDLYQIESLFELQTAIKNYFAKVSELVAVRNGEVLYDGEPVAGELTEQIVKFYEEGADATPLVLFFEKLQSNPSEHSKENLYRWMRSRDYSISPAGDLIAYKSVRSDFGSHHYGPGIVNGVEQDGHLNNTPGNVLEMARSEVEFNPAIGCAAGLHVSNWNYASSFGGYGSKIVEVHVNPRDIVSVPTDSYDEKMRVSRYKVVRELEKAYDTAFVDSSYEDEDDDDFDDWYDQVDEEEVELVDTTQNYKKQKRDAYGRFVKNGV